jgi:hypothetical protein
MQTIRRQTMNKRELRKLAKSKGLGFFISEGLFFFLKPGDSNGYAATKKVIEQVRLLPDYVEPQESDHIDSVPTDAVSLEGLTREERDTKVLELLGSPKPNDLPGLDNYPIAEDQ